MTIHEVEAENLSLRFSGAAAVVAALIRLCNGVQLGGPISALATTGRPAVILEATLPLTV